MATLFAGLCAGNAVAADAAGTAQLQTVEVIGTTPLPGIGTPTRDVPANVQVYTAKDLDQQHQSNLSEYLEQTPTSVSINAAQGNPFQADINFRGFTASPVLGTPQGLSVFQDGVRVNEPFGDVVNWDLIPQSAISSMQLIPGSNPTFGLNTLGGALAIYTKRGTTDRGGSIEAFGGSYGRKGGDFEYGGSKGPIDYFVTANYSDDDGWAEHNASTVRQFFGKLGYQDELTDVTLSLTTANNALQGTQTLPRSFFNDDIRQPYTWPDINENKLTFLTLNATRYLSDNVSLGGNVYYRKYRNTNFSSNVNDEFGEIDPDTGLPDTTEATNDRSAIDQESFGLGAQLTVLGRLGRMENQLVVGASGDFGDARFTQDSQTARFNPDRGTAATSAFGRETDADTTNRYYGVYFTDSLHLTPKWTLTGSGRFNLARVKIEDRSGEDAALNGRHTFTRFNPAIGLNYSPSSSLTAYATYNEGMRAPTPIELTCANPEAPCKLPNEFLADPPLKKVVSHTLEGGLRGTFGPGTTWSAAAYHTRLADDIQFISSSGATNAGYFRNVGDTRRQGVELAVGKRWEAWSVSARYSYVDATYESAFSVHAPSNSSADAGGDIHVKPGDRIPGIPRNTLKLRVEYAFGDRATLGTNIVTTSGVYARGDDNNRDVNGRIPGYTVVNLDGRYVLERNLELFFRVANLFDRKYATMGALGENFFANPAQTFDADNTVNEQFRGPGAPRGGWVGVRYRWL